MTSRRRMLAEGHTNAGFTLVEMLVAVVAGAMTIATVYSLGAGSTRAFQEQNRISQAQAAVRSGMEHVRRDFSRAGFGATPDSGTSASDGDRGANPAGCAVTPGFRLVGFAVNDNAYTAQLWLADDAHNRVQADGVVMSGNFATGDHYLVSEIVGGPPSRSSRRGSRSGAASGPRSIRSASKMPSVRGAGSTWSPRRVAGWRARSLPSTAPRPPSRSRRASASVASGMGGVRASAPSRAWSTTRPRPRTTPRSRGSCRQAARPSATRVAWSRRFWRGVNSASATPTPRLPTASAWCSSTWSTSTPPSRVPPPPLEWWTPASWRRSTVMEERPHSLPTPAPGGRCA
ncbi:MAG: prepilin-type N-terminal cleavage/methylation domain-containing protein [Sandaracinaceae bacterium]|nr:prepilin-type N-terminal cleavage/methylation domain-containing protein [Sandaracinaceae bacterium]